MSLFFTDAWLERQLENIGSLLVGAKVEIDNLDISLVGAHIRWDSLQVTDPADTWKNLFSTGRSELDMQFLPLLSNKIIVDQVLFADLNSGTKRSTDGKLDKPVAVKPNFFTRTIAQLNGDVSQAPAWNLDQFAKKVNVDSIISLLDIRSPAKIDSFRKDLNENFGKWDKIFTETDLTGIRRVEDKVKGIMPADIKTLDGLVSAMETVKSVQTSIDSAKNFVTTTKNDLTGDLQSVQGGVGLVDNWVKDDYTRALQKAKLPDLSKQNIGKFIFGDKIVAQLNRALQIAGTAREYSSKFQSDKPKKEKPPRLKGQNIHFPLKKATPKFWIKEIKVTGKTAGALAFSGQISDIVSNQSVIGQPTVISINGTRGDKAALTLAGEFNYLEDIPRESFKVNMAQIPMKDVKLSNSALLPNALSRGIGSVDADVDIRGEQLTGGIDFVGQNLQFAVQEKTEKSDVFLEKIQMMISNTSTIDFRSRVKSQGEELDFSVNSNLDDVVYQQFRSIVSSEIDETKKNIQNKVGEKVNKVQSEFTTFVSDKKEALESQMQKVEQLVENNVQMVENKKKELEERIEAEKKKQGEKLEGELKKRLDGLF